MVSSRIDGVIDCVGAISCGLFKTKDALKVELGQQVTSHPVASVYLGTQLSPSDLGVDWV